MKTTIYFLCFLFIFTATACCDKTPKPLPVAPVEQLPPYTETGANTFGCLIDGEVFVPKKNPFSLGTALQCQYQYVNSKYIFSLSGADFVTDTGNASVSFIGSHENDFLKEKDNYAMSNTDLNSFLGKASEKRGNATVRFYTNDTVNGSINVKYLNKEKQIVSGTFWFDAIDTTTGKIIHVTDGRFDVRFTR